MKLLAIETATEACSVALYLDGEVQESYRIAPRQHTELVLGMADALLAEAGLKLGALDALAFGRGPGAFTGVRIATAVIQGMAFAADLPVVPVSTLAALAQRGFTQYGWTNVAAAIDARMNEVYWGTFEARDGLICSLQDERVCPAEQTPLLDGEGWYGIGSGWQTYAEALSARHGKAICEYRGEEFPHAADVAVLAVADIDNAVSADQAIPVYLRDKVVG
jgi:tRNA threonylcarbamoyladenosine biosynthesis protein TsaB